ncbi:glutamine-hydrolyzing GMP synthase [Anaerotignum sp. MSJ-24]|uniref:glutamine-hydrolyzing GMP synthase n=1 Tax=Anaerotignum sp. MSJ-24 TaxID=2841521 RepID=UPI001C0F75FC|nr:glutamine-hydrolyzing GMP synthase [Anaerotignum sp. MSJ-24]MBU5463425.1 glutamine-hydrolyzing GMP synthase [Anaerotignum sp. MSJ-24]
MKNQFVLILDFGGQYNQLIARRVRECNVYCEVKPYTMSIDEIKEKNPVGIIFTGGPNSVYDEKSPHISKEVFELGVPVLGICYGCQIMAYTLGGTVTSANSKSEYGKTEVTLDTASKLFKGVNKEEICWMSHTDYVSQVPEGFKVTATSSTCPTAAMECPEKNFYAVQFHPEVNHTPNGRTMLKNFLYDVCGCTGDWVMKNYIEEQIKAIREKVGDGKALCALSGGVDSSVVAALVSKAIGKQLTCVFVDHGLMRKNEGDEVEHVFDGFFDSNFVRVNAKDRFLDKLKGVKDPEKKRKIIGEEFIRVFEDEAKKIGKVDFLVQGTIYPDVIESGLGDSAVIKSHHNVGGLPSVVDFKELIEPLRLLFKDEVRQMGTELGLPDYIVWRQPFPGPGLGIRVIGEVTEDKLEILRDADAIFREEIKNAGLDRSINQYFAVITDLRSVGVMGDGRTYDYTIALRGVTTTDFMTADWARIPYDVLDRVSVRIVNEVKHVNRVCYDITSKPPATIEWE